MWFIIEQLFAVTNAVGYKNSNMAYDNLVAFSNISKMVWGYCMYHNWAPNTSRYFVERIVVYQVSARKSVGSSYNIQMVFHDTTLDLRGYRVIQHNIYANVAAMTQWRYQMETIPWPFVQGIHRSLHKGQWRGALKFSFIFAWTNGWVNNRDTGNLRCHHAHYDFIAALNISKQLQNYVCRTDM